MPEIVFSPGNEHILAPPIIEHPRTSNDDSYDNDVPRTWYPPSGAEKQWTAIIVHHSATEKGNAAIFNKWHIEQHGWDGVGYDFVIGNGTDSGDGQVEVTFRWRQQITGAHCKTPDNWANEDGIGICLVGNFNNYRPTERQMQSLVNLTRFLKKRYGISNSRIYGHGTTPGANVTDCPGSMFPIARFKSMVGS
ncbi:MAG: N-acetylmuramoyl-L-alanine amidase [Sedimentisphaerales bacterium]|nr:N-acetylmuramoyl-L-alanine amidase [Sedimentisphaerales bacterium]